MYSIKEKFRKLILIKVKYINLIKIIFIQYHIKLIIIKNEGNLFIFHIKNSF